MHKRKPEFERFIKKVNKTETCWWWTGAKYRGGYGHFGRWVNDIWRMYKTHRYSYEYFVGPIPAGAMVCHTCDNPGCVNPKHLFTGTARDNVLDKISKGRQPLIRNPKHNLLTLEFANRMRKFKMNTPEMNQVDIAKHFGTSPAQTSRILNNKIWSQA